MRITKLKIVRDILQDLNLKEDAHLENFFLNEIEEFENAIEGITQNINVLDIKFKGEVRSIDKSIADAEKDYKQAFKQVDVKAIVNNAGISSFRIKYWENIEKCKKSLEALKVAKKVSQEKYEKTLADFNDQISKYKERISSISEENFNTEK